MTSERIAEVLAAHALWGEILVCECERWHFDAEVDNDPYSGHAKHVADALTQAGFGHVPTSLHQAADDAEAEARRGPRNQVYDGWIEAAGFVRARADRAGGDNV